MLKRNCAWCGKPRHPERLRPLGKWRVCPVHVANTPPLGLAWKRAILDHDLATMRRVHTERYGATT